MNTKIKGELAEAKILTRLLETGQQVAIPFGDSQRYDLIVIGDDNKAIRVQCKTGWLRNGIIKFKTVSHNPFDWSNKGYLGEADVFMVYCFELDKVYQIDVSEVSHYKYCCSLRVDAAKNNQWLNIMWAKNYEY